MRVDVATGASRVLDTASSFDGEPCWTEDGGIVAGRARGARHEYVEYRRAGTRRRLRRFDPALHAMFGPGCVNVAEGPQRPNNADRTSLVVRPVAGGAAVATLASSWPVGGTGLAWSADGRLLADVDDSRPRAAIRVTDVTTGRVVVRTPGPTTFARIPPGAVAPDGRALLVRQYGYADGGALSEVAATIFDVAGGTFRDLVRHRFSAGGRTPGPEAWSPRGDLIAVVQAQELHLFDPAGADLGTVRAGSRVRDIVWSPDGSRLAVQRLGRVRPGPVREYAREVVVVAAEPGARARTVFRDMRKDAMPAWSPDGRRLALVDD